MKKRFLTLCSVVLLTAGSQTVLAAPQTMPDGTVFDAEYYAEAYPDVAAVLGTDAAVLYQHYVNHGKQEGRSPYAADVAADMVQTVTQPAVIKDEEGVTYVIREVDKDVDLPTGGMTKRKVPTKFYLLGADTEYVRSQGGSGSKIDPVTGEWYSSFNWDRDLEGIPAVKRTDFADGLLDLDGNGIDDRDPINSMGFVDLNYDGVDDRQQVKNIGYRRYYKTGELVNVGYDEVTDAQAIDWSSFQQSASFASTGYKSLSYLCPHGVVCSMENPIQVFSEKSDRTLHEFYKEFGNAFYDVLCPTCNAQALSYYSAEQEKVAWEENLKNAKMLLETAGYKPGVTEVFESGKTMTNQGDDIMVDQNGECWEVNQYLYQNGQPYKVSLRKMSNSGGIVLFMSIPFK